MKDVSQYDWWPILVGNPFCTGISFQPHWGRGRLKGTDAGRLSERGPAARVQPSTLPSNRAVASSSLLCLGFLFNQMNPRLKNTGLGDKTEQQRTIVLPIDIYQENNRQASYLVWPVVCSVWRTGGKADAFAEVYAFSGKMERDEILFLVYLFILLVENKQMKDSRC